MPSTAGLPGGALPFSGPLDLASINAEWGLGTDLTKYHGVKWYYDGNLTYGYFTSGVSSIRISDFYGKRATDPASSGIYFSNSVGSGSTIAPLYRNSITIEVWGGGGSGGGGNGGNGSNGGDISILGVIVGGGSGGQSGNIPIPPPPPVVDSSRGGRDTTGGGYYSGFGGGYYGNDGQTHNDANQAGPGPGGTYGHI